MKLLIILVLVLFNSELYAKNENAIIKNSIAVLCDTGSNDTEKYWKVDKSNKDIIVVNIIEYEKEYIQIPLKKTDWNLIKKSLILDNKGCSNNISKIIGKSISSDIIEIPYDDYIFHIPKSEILKKKELVFLVLYTEAMKSEEKQHWFDIIPSLLKEQVDKLYNILETERVKLQELDGKYVDLIEKLKKIELDENFNKLKKQISVGINKYVSENENVLNMNYLSYSENETPRIKILPVSGKIKNIYLPRKDIITSHLENIVILEFAKIMMKNSKEYKKLYSDNVLNLYINKIVDISIKLNDMSVLIKIYKNNFSKKEDIIRTKYLYKNDYKSLALLYKEDLKNGELNGDIFLKLMDLTIWRFNLKCKIECTNVLNLYFDKMMYEDFPFKYKNLNDAFQTELILIDMILYFNKDIMKDRYAKTFKKFIDNYIDKKTSFVKEKRNWYYKLNTSYYDKTIDKIYKTLSKKYYSSDDFISSEGDLMEVITYYSFLKIKNNKREDARKMLLLSKKLGSSIYSGGYDYIEKKYIDFLISVSFKPENFRKGPLELGTYRVKNGKKTFNPFGKKYAIIIGVADYKELSESTNIYNNSGLYDLLYADKDANNFKKFLETPEKSGGDWEIHSFIGDNADNINVRKTIDSILSNANPNDLVYIFFSGHARLNPNNNEEVYLLPYDFNPKNPYSGIPYDWLISTINRSNAKYLITFIDACRSGTIKNSKGTSSVDQDLLSNVAIQSPTKVIFTSGSGSQISYEDKKFKEGIFTHFLLKGLYGDANDDNKDGFVNLNELEDYTSKKVSIYTNNSKNTTYQRPKVSNLDPTYSVQFPLSIR